MSLKSWGLELWDQIDKVFTYCQQGQDQLDLFHKTLSEYQKIYQNLTRKHKALLVPITNGKTKLVLDNSTYMSSLDGVLQCMTEQANIYDKQSEEIKDKCIVPLKAMFDELKTVINTQSTEYGKFKANIETQKRLLDRAWAKYFTAFNIKKKGEIAYIKIKDDKTVPRVDIEKIQNQASQKKAEFEKTRCEYAEFNQKYNETIAHLYLKDLPAICSALEIVDRKRCEVTMQVGQELAAIQRANLDKTREVSAAKLETEFSKINGKQDAEELVTLLKSKLYQPPDMIFIDLEKIPVNLGGGSSEPSAFNPSKIEGLLQQGGKAGKGDVAKSLFAGNGLKGFELTQMLPEQINKKAHHVQETIKAVEKQLTGIQNLYQTFEKEPQMGDKNSLDPEIDVNKRQLLSLQDMETEISKYIDSNGVCSTRPANPPNVDDTKSDDDNMSDSFSDDEEVASVLYTFEAIDAQQMAVTKGEKVIIVKYDEGNSGWTLAKSMTDSNLTGFVPTNYIERENQ